jgi:hypothetical protein
MGWKQAFDRWALRTGLVPAMLQHEWSKPAFRAGYLAAQRDAKVDEEQSRHRLAKTEAAIALQVASGGVAGDVDQVAEAGRLLEAVERVGSDVVGKRVA